MDGLSGLADALGMGGQAAAPLWQKILLGGMLGMGELGNILSENKRSSYQDMLLKIAKDPSQLARMATQTAAPLSNALVQEINNRVQGDMAARGLAQAPGIFGATEAQALAPFVQQNQNTAMQAVLSALGLPAGTFQQPENLSPLLGMFLRSFGTKGRMPIPGAPEFSPGLTWPGMDTGESPPGPPMIPGVG